MRKLKKIVTYVIAFILSIMIILSILIYLLSSTILNKNYILKKLDETNYYEQIYELVESNFENYIQQSGLDEDVIKNLITEEKIKEDTEQILINLYDGLNEEISTKEISENLSANIKKSLGDRELTSNEETAVETFIQTICDEYENTILHTNYEEQINDLYQNATKYKKYAIQALSIIIGVLLVILIIINNRAIYRTVKAIAIALLSDGVLLTLINIYINSNLKVENIKIFNDAFSEVIVNILEEILNNMLVYGIISIIFGIVFIIVSNLVHNIRKYEIRER